MQNLFEKAVAISNDVNSINEGTALENHINEIFELVLNYHEENILQAAQAGRKFAIIFLWHENARKRGIVNISKLFNPHGLLQEKMQEYELQALHDRIQEHFYPFEVKIYNMYEFLDMFFHYRLDLAKKFNVLTICW